MIATLDAEHERQEVLFALMPWVYANANRGNHGVMDIGEFMPSRMAERSDLQAQAKTVIQKFRDLLKRRPELAA